VSACSGCKGKVGCDTETEDRMQHPRRTRPWLGSKREARSWRTNSTAAHKLLQGRNCLHPCFFPPGDEILARVRAGISTAMSGWASVKLLGDEARSPVPRLILLRGVLGRASGCRGCPLFLSDTDLACAGTPEGFRFS